MSGIGGGPGSGPQGAVARLVAVPLRWLRVSTGVTALAVSGLFGGLDGVDKPAQPTVEVGAVDRASPGM